MTQHIDIGKFRDHFDAIKNGKEEWSLDFLEQLYADNARYQLLEIAVSNGASLGCVNLDDGCRSLMHKAADELDANAIEFLYQHGGTLGQAENIYYPASEYAGWNLIQRFGRLCHPPNEGDSAEALSEWKDSFNKARACFSILCARCDDLTWRVNEYDDIPLSFLLYQKADAEFITEVANRTRFEILYETTTLAIVNRMRYLPPDSFFELLEALQGSQWCPAIESIARRVMHFRTPYKYELLERLVIDINPDARDQMGRTLLDLADYYDEDKIVSLLERRGICRSGNDPATADEYAKLDHQVKHYARGHFANFRASVGKPHATLLRGFLDELIDRIRDIDPYEPEAMRWVVYEKLHDDESIEDVSDFVDMACSEMQNSRFYALYSYSIKGLSAGVSPESYLRMYLCILLSEKKLYEEAVEALARVKQSELDAAFLENHEWSAAINAYFFAKGYDRKFLDILDHWKAQFPERYEACVAFEGMRGWAYWRLKDLVAAELCFRAVIESRRAKLDTHYGLVSVLMEQDLYEEAAIACDSPLKSSTDARHVFLRAKVAYFNNDEDGAAVLVDQLLLEKPDHKGALALKRKLYS